MEGFAKVYRTVLHLFLVDLRLFFIVVLQFWLGTSHVALIKSLSYPFTKMLMNVRGKRTVLDKQDVRILLDHFSAFAKLDSVAAENTARVGLNFFNPSQARGSNLGLLEETLFRGYSVKLGEHVIEFHLIYFDIFFPHTDIDECENSEQCSPHAKCQNFDGSYKCTCNLGYYGNGKICKGTIIFITSKACSFQHNMAQ